MGLRVLADDIATAPWGPVAVGWSGQVRVYGFLGVFFIQNNSLFYFYFFIIIIIIVVVVTFGSNSVE